MIVAPRFRVADLPIAQGCGLAADLVARDRLNAKDWARPFVARLLEPGLCSYEDSGCGKVLLRKETLDRCVRSFVGRPVVVKQGKRIKPKLGRPEFVHAKTTPDNMKEIGHGYVTDVFYNEGDGWWYGRGVVDTDEAAKAIKEVGKCSCGYGVKAAGPGGLWHDIPYEEEILEFSGEHLAVVDAPRYEEATIRLNSKNTSGSNMSSFKWIKKLASRVAGGDDAAAQAAAADKAAADKLAADAATKNNAKVEAEDISGETSFDVPTADGKTETVTLAALIEAHNAKRNATTDMDGDDEIMCNGKKYKVNALVEAFDKWSKTNATDDEKKKLDEAKNAKADADAATQAAADAAEKKKLEDAQNAKAGSRHFNVLINARETAPAPESASALNTLEERLARGRSLYGSKKK